MQQFAPKGLETAERCGTALLWEGVSTWGSDRGVRRSWSPERSPRRGKLRACDFWQQKDGSALRSGRLWGDLTAAPQAVETPEPDSSLQLTSILGGFKTQRGKALRSLVQAWSSPAFSRLEEKPPEVPQIAYIIIPVTCLAHLNAVLPCSAYENGKFPYALCPFQENQLF